MIDHFIVDFYCHMEDLVIEVVGGIHNEQEENDRERDQQLEDRGLRVLHFTNRDINQQMESVLSSILDSCNAKRSQDSPA